MKAVIQRVAQAQVTVEGELVGSIGQGLLVLLGVAGGDTEAEAEILADKICNLRIFGDNAGKMNLSVVDVGGAVLSVSQFTLLADTQRGRRPSFVKAASPEVAQELYERFSALVACRGVRVERSIFAAHMMVSLLNYGPVTLVLDTAGR